MPTGIGIGMTPHLSQVNEASDFVTENNTLAAYLGDAVATVNIQTRYGSTGWKLVAAGYDTNGTTPLFIYYNTNTKEYACDTWTLAGGNTTKVNRSCLKETSDDLLVGLANEVTNYRHKPTAWRIYKGKIFVQCNVEDKGSGSYQATYMALATSDDYGATWQLINRSDSATPYIIPPGSYINLTPSAGKATGQHWSMTVQEVSSTRLDVMMADYHGNPSSPGGTHHYCQFTGGVGSWTSGKVRQIDQRIATGLHAHIGFNKKIYYGDTTVNQTYSFSFDDGDSNYETSNITITQIEATGSGSQPVNAAADSSGQSILSPDNQSGVVLVYDSSRSRIVPRMGIHVATRSGGNESFMLENSRGTGIPQTYYQPYRPTSSASIPASSRRAFVSKDGIAWANTRYDADFNDSAGTFPHVLYSAGTHYLFDVISEIFTAEPITFKTCTPTASAKGGTNVLTGSLTNTALTDAVVRTCPLVGGKYMWPTGTPGAGQPISPQPTDRTSTVLYIEAATGSGDEVNIDMGSTVAAGNYIAKAYVMAAQNTRISSTFKLTNTSDAAVTTWTADNSAAYWREVNPFYSPAGTVTLRLKCGVSAGQKMFVQYVGVHSGKLPLDNHSYGTTTVPDNTYQTAIPTTGVNGAGFVVSRFRLTGTPDSYFANLNSTGSIVLAEYREDANNHVQLRMTPNATLTSESTFALVQTVVGVETTLGSHTGWLNNRDDIVFGISRDVSDGGVFATVGLQVLSGDFASSDIYADYVRAGSLPCDHLFSVTDGNESQMLGSNLAVFYPSFI